MSDTKQKFIDAVVKGIAELPDRSSPEGHPELMQCTAEEVVDVLLVVYREHIAALEADAARLDFLNLIGEAYGFESTIEGYRWEVSGAFRTVRDAIDSERVAVEAEATINAAMKGGA